MGREIHSRAHRLPGQISNMLSDSMLWAFVSEAQELQKLRICSPGFNVLPSGFFTCLNLASPDVVKMSWSQAAPLSEDLGEPARLLGHWTEWFC